MAPSAPREIARNGPKLSRTVSSSFDIATSPSASFHSPVHSSGGRRLSRTSTRPSVKQLKPFATEDIKILLLENVNQTGRDLLSKQGYQVEFLKTSLPEEQLIEKIRFVEPRLSRVRPHR